MKFLSLVILGSVLALGGCAANVTPKDATVAEEDGYTPLGSMIHRKGKSDTETMDIKDLENAHNIPTGTINRPPGS